MRIWCQNSAHNPLGPRLRPRLHSPLQAPAPKLWRNCGIRILDRDHGGREQQHPPFHLQLGRRRRLPLVGRVPLLQLHGADGRDPRRAAPGGALQVRGDDRGRPGVSLPRALRGRAGEEDYQVRDSFDHGQSQRAS